jgi:hypothetical protein
MSTSEHFGARVEALVAMANASMQRTAQRALMSDLDLSPALARVDPLAEFHSLDQLGVSDFQQRFQLSVAEMHFVWTLAAFAADHRVHDVAQQQFGHHAQAGLSLGQHSLWHTISPEEQHELLDVLVATHPLRRFGIAEPVLDDSHGTATPWRITQAALAYLRGASMLCAELGDISGVVDPEPHGFCLSHDQQRVVDQVKHALGSYRTDLTIALEGCAQSGRATACANAAQPAHVFAVDYQRVAPSQALAIVTAHVRQCAFTDAVPLFRNIDVLIERLSDPVWLATLLALSAALQRITTPLLLTTQAAKLHLPGTDRSLARWRWPLPDAATRKQLWSNNSKNISVNVSNQDLDLLAQRYHMGPGGIAAAIRSASLAEQHNRQLGFAQIVGGVQATITEQLAGLATRIEVNQTWNDLVVAPETNEDIAGLLARATFSHAVLDGWGFRRKLARGAGIAALFSGPPGTGKTMVAGLIARDLELELYQVDLSNIVSKWVGETEKQLSKLFDAAEAGHALLLFDEADSLFAKRSADVKSATDRYANLEVNYLLQRVESFGGFVILTTNLDTSIDPALRRRLAAHLVFTAPETAERSKLWRDMITTQTTTGKSPLANDINFAFLADEFADMTGANIRNAAIAAAFLAAKDNSLITHQHLMRAARSEYRSMGRVLARGRD